MDILNSIIEYINSAHVASAVITPLKVDGYADKATIKMLEGYFGCKKTGVLTGQKETLMRKYAPNVTAYNTKKKKSAVVMKLQAWVEFAPAYINGIWDNNLSYALQIKLTSLGFNTGTCDGVFGKNSVKALQRFLNAQIPQPTPTTVGELVMKACKEQADWMHSAKYGDYSPVTLEHSKKRGTCVTYEGCVFQRLGVLASGKYVWHTGKGYGTGKVTGANNKMTVTYMNNKKLSSLKHIIQKGDCILLDDNKSGEGGNGGHVFFATGQWKGNKPYIWDVAPGMTCCENGEPRTYSGSRKVLAIVRLKG